MNRLKHLLYALAAFLLCATTAYATPISWDAASNVLQPLQAQRSYQVKGSYFTATSTSASTFPNASTTNLSATTICIGTDCRTVWPSAGGASFAYLFPSNATSTALTFSGGLSASALTDSGVGAGTLNATSGGLLYSTATSSLAVTGPITVTGTLGAAIGGTSATIGCQTASGSQAGCLSSADWTTFNGKQGALTFSTGLTNTAGTVTVNTSQNIATLSNLTVAGFVQTTSGGVLSSAALTSGQVTGALGFTPYNATNPSSFIALTALSGTAPITYNNSTGAFGCTTATGSVAGCLSAADWTTFNSKQGALTLTTTGATGAATLVGTTLNIPQYAGGAAFPFTPATDFGLTTSATTTALWGQNSIFASSTSATLPAFAASNTSGPSALFSLGNVGIGTSTPWGQLSINPTAANGAKPAFVVGSSSATDLIVDNTGDVGIGGLPIANTKLSIFGPGGGNGIDLASNDQSLLARIIRNNGAVDSTLYLGYNQGGGGQINFYGQGTTPQATLIGTTGNFGVGTTTPWGLLSLNPTSALGTTPAFVIGSSTATKFIVSSAGNVGIGSTSPTYSLSIGNGTASSSATVAEYAYGAGTNVATSTAYTFGPILASNHIVWPIGTAAATFTLCMTPGQTLTIRILNPNASAGAVTWQACSGEQLYWPSATVPTQTTAANQWDVWSFIASQTVGSSSSATVISGAQSSAY